MKQRFRITFEGERWEAEMLQRFAQKMGVDVRKLEEYGVGFP